MATLKFYLKKANKQNLFPVLMCYQDRGEKFRFSTKVYATKSNWLKNRLKATSLEDYENNEKLESCEKVIKEIEKESIITGSQLRVSEVEKLFRENILKTEAYKNSNPVSESDMKIESNFFVLYEQFIASSRSIRTKSTIAQYKRGKTILMKFEKAFGREISFECINTSFYEKFQNFLINDLKHLNNTVGGQIKNLKVFLNYVMRHELTDIKFNFHNFKTIKEDIDIVALTETELFNLYTCNSLNAQQSIARDYLCFECFTGLRFSDIGGLRNENIKDDFIVLKTKKTKDTLFIPINGFARRIMDKYSGKYSGRPLPPSFSNPKINQHIKEAAKIAGIEELTMIEKFNGSNRISITEPKYKLISTHTGRRTFITLSYEKGMQTEMIMKITGIRKWDTLKKYLKVSEKSKLLKMNEFWNLDSLANYQNTEKNANSCHI
ncbi:site-specific integrase [Asinibacterium sp. OR53]|uniref:site-specific integrase n=1 Tax=Asinibacterium sp. OR53 TaxID=925409 RepID=UPI00047C4D5C|nr:site-specific integrase [Asinibacterium sp. OR53]